MGLLPALLGLLPGCTSEAEEFAHRRADAICAWHARCDTLEMAGFTSPEACATALYEAADNTSGACEDYDAGAADACVAAWTDADCDAQVDLSACEGVCG